MQSDWMAKRHVCLGKTPARVEPRAPRDPAAWTRPCLLGIACTFPSSECAGRCPPLRNPYTGSFPDCAGRCPPLRNPCIGTYPDCAGKCCLLRAPFPVLHQRPAPCVFLSFGPGAEGPPALPRGLVRGCCTSEPFCPCKREHLFRLLYADVDNIFKC